MKQKSENQKAFPRFLGILVVAGLIGGVLGGLSGVAGYFWLPVPPCCWVLDCTSTAKPEPPSAAGTARTRT